MPGFRDIVGHKEAIQHLESAMKLDKVSHAYIAFNVKLYAAFAV